MSFSEGEEHPVLKWCISLAFHLEKEEHVPVLLCGDRPWVQLRDAASPRVHRALYVMEGGEVGLE